MPEEENSTVVIVEYLGEWQGSAPHGNAKRTTQPYKRTTIEQQSVIRDGVKHGKLPIQILKNVNSLDPENPINIKFIQNEKYRSSLGYDLPEEKLTFGTDEEMALVNAIKTTFPKAGHILCTRHLQENAIRNLNKHNIPEASKNKLINSIFPPLVSFLLTAL